MAEFSLTVEPRPAGRPRRDRAEGFVPGVVYGQGQEPESVRVSERDLRDLLASGGHRHVVHLKKTGSRAKPRAAVIKEMQRDPLRGRVLHVDFLTVSLDTKIRAQVPILVHGEEQAKKTGGIVQHQMHEIEVECLPGNLPEAIVVDVADLRPGDAVHVRDLRAPEGVAFVEDAGALVVSVVIPRAVEAARKAEESGTPAEAEEASDDGA